MGWRVFSNAQLLDPEAAGEAPGALVVRDGRIEGRLRPDEAGPAEAERIDLAGRALAPGFLDLHHHGGLIFCPPAETRTALARDAASMARHGTTAFLPTTVAWPRPELAERVKVLSDCVRSHDAAGAEPLGVHLEGPWIRPEAAGAQPSVGIRPYSASEGRALLDSSGDSVRLVTLAPETEGADGLLAELAGRGIVAALGHSLADAEQIERGIDRGMRHVTHLFNAMGGVHHRERGVAGVALADDRLSCDLICDGVHVHPQIVRLAARAKGAKLLLITDRMEPPADGSGGGYGAGRVREEGGAFRLADGTLAASSLTLDRALRNVMCFGAMTRLEAVAACTIRPARLLGIEAERGSLRRGARADLVVLDAEDRVAETWIGGKRSFSADAG